jgi:hypothetical protein
MDEKYLQKIFLRSDVIRHKKIEHDRKLEEKKSLQHMQDHPHQAEDDEHNDFIGHNGLDQRNESFGDKKVPTTPSGDREMSNFDFRSDEVDDEVNIEIPL